MAEKPAHSPAPFRLHQVESGHWLLIDAFGDSIGSLAGRTGDHPPREQEANAVLFQHSPELAEMVARLLVEVDQEVEQRKTGGNAEDWQKLEWLAAEARILLARARISEETGQC